MVLAVFSLSLAFCATKRECLVSLAGLRSAWLFYGWAVILQILFAIIEAVVRVDNGYDVKESMAVVEGWQQAVTWLLLALAVFALRDAFTSPPTRTGISESGGQVQIQQRQYSAPARAGISESKGQVQTQQRQYSAMSHDELSVLWNEFLRCNPDGARAHNRDVLWKEFLVSKGISFEH